MFAYVFSQTALTSSLEHSSGSVGAPSAGEERADLKKDAFTVLGLEQLGLVEVATPAAIDSCSLAEHVGPSEKAEATAQLTCTWGGHRVSSDADGIALDLLLWLKDLGVGSSLLCDTDSVSYKTVERGAEATPAVLPTQPSLTSIQNVELSLAIRRALSDLLHTTAMICQRDYKESERTHGDIPDSHLQAEKFADTQALYLACDERILELQGARDDNAAKLEMCQQDIDAKSIILSELQQVSEEELVRHRDASLLLAKADERELHLRIELAEKIERLHQTQALYDDVLEQLARARRDGNLMQSSICDRGAFFGIENSSSLPEHSPSNTTLISAAHAGAEAKEYLGTARGAVEEITPESMDHISAANEVTTSAKDLSVPGLSFAANVSLEWLKTLMHMTVNRITVAAERSFPSRARESRGLVSLGTFISANADGTHKLLLRTLNLLGISLMGQQNEIHVAVQAMLYIVAVVFVVILSCALRRASNFIFRRRRESAEHQQGRFAQNMETKDTPDEPTSTPSSESNDVHSTDSQTEQQRSVPRRQTHPVSETSRIDSSTYFTSSHIVEPVRELKNMATDTMMKDPALHDSFIQKTPTQEYTNGGLGRLPQMRRGPPPRVFPSLKGSETGDTI